MLLQTHKKSHSYAPEILRLAKKYLGMQIVVRVCFDICGYDFLHECAQEWGRSFIIMALRVVYVLEKRYIERLGEMEKYEGFRMFKIFMEKYPDMLEKFFELKNPALLAVLRIKLEAKEFR